ncbi:MAG: GntR family transcriptional regulator [Marinifilaceae bacterium]|jgi:DNA-binding transcriptional regulator YhcF (GntR family)
MEFDNQQAIYLQIADHICEHILMGKWIEGERIASVREMAVSIEVNPNTVMRTYSHLQDKGIIFNKRGIGYFVSEGALKEIKEMKKIVFIESELPKLFNTMYLLNISPKELEEKFKEFKKKKDSEAA